MIVSWNWLKQYVPLTMSLAELEERLMMAGLNHEGTNEVAGDMAVDLEVTSNRPDCLGHLGIAREVAVLFGGELTVPPAAPAEGKTPAEGLVKVRIDCPELCYRYTARVIRGAKIGPSPKWMTRRLETVGITPINNVVDISNYVLMECGQPLHTFDFGKLRGGQIIVRGAKPGEQIEAIDHKTYDLKPEMCMICDAEAPVAIGGVMGDAHTEISEETTDVLIEAAEFDPMSIRATARALNLHSDSSYRFERCVDPEGIDWASRRCCELILELAGGELAKGVVDVGQQPAAREPVVLRLSQLKRVLGIDVPGDRVREILMALGCAEHGQACCETNTTATRPHPGPLPKEEGEVAVAVVPPSWRRDLTREIDLVEEVARIHGYDKIPEDVSVPMVASTRRKEDRVFEKVRNALTASGFDEAMTYSVLDEQAVGTFRLWTDAEPLRSHTPVLRGADHLRISLVPSLLVARRTNEALANPVIELFEIAKAYLPRGKKLPDEQYMLGMTSGRDYGQLKGVVEAAVQALRPAAELTATNIACDMLEPAASCLLELDGTMFGYVGTLSAAGLKQFELRSPTTVAEIKLSLLVDAANLVPRYSELPSYPAVSRDLNLVVDESVRWADIASTVKGQCGEFFEDLRYVDTYRDEKRLGTDKKSLLMTFDLRSAEGTMTNQQADEIRDTIVAACREKHAAELR